MQLPFSSMLHAHQVKKFLHTIAATVHKFRCDYRYTEPEPDHNGVKLKCAEPNVPVKHLPGIALALCFILLASALFALDAVPNSEQIVITNNSASQDSLLQFPLELIGIWVADEPDYIEPSGWEEWYRNIEIGYWEDGSLGIQYGSLVGSTVLSVKYDGVIYTVEVLTEADEKTNYFFRMQKDRLWVKAPRVIVYNPDEYKAYHRFRYERLDKEE